MEKISCIVPVYNVKSYLVRCLESLCAQTYPNVEIILVDDGSTDGSEHICDEYALRSKNIKVKHIKNGGASLARKKGLDIASGEYITFIDSDDYVSVDYIKKMYDALQGQKLSISACKVQRIKESESFILSNKYNGQQIIFYNELMYRFYHYEFWGLYGKLYKKKIFKDIYFPKATLSEDYVVMVQLLNICKNIVYIDTPLYFYEYHENSLSHQKLSKRAFEEFENVVYVYRFTIKNCDDYASYALNNVMETAVKLLLLEKEDTLHKFSLEYGEIRTFIKKHSFKILFSTTILNKLKLLGFSFYVFPQISSYIYSKLNSR